MTDKRITDFVTVDFRPDILIPGVDLTRPAGMQNVKVLGSTFPGLTVISPTAPPSPVLGELWWNTTDGRTYIWAGTTWVEISGEGVVATTAPVIDPTGYHEYTLQSYVSGTDPVSLTTVDGLIVTLPQGTNRSAGVFSIDLLAIELSSGDTIEGGATYTWSLTNGLVMRGDEHTNSAGIGSITDNVLTITELTADPFVIGQYLIGAVADNTIILSQESGTSGDVGTYTVSITQMVASTDLQAGAFNYSMSDGNPPFVSGPTSTLPPSPPGILPTVTVDNVNGGIAIQVISPDEHTWHVIARLQILITTNTD